MMRRIWAASSTFLRRCSPQKGCSAISSRVLRSGAEREETTCAMRPSSAGSMAGAAVLPLLAAKMAPGGVVLCETEREAELPEQAGALTLVKQYNYGKIKVSRYERGEEA